MNNVINENNLLMTQEKSDKGSKSPFKRINTAKQDNKEVDNENKNINNNYIKDKHKLALSPTLCRKKSGNINDIRNILEHSYKIKYSNQIEDDHIKLNVAKTIKNNNPKREKDIYFGDASPICLPKRKSLICRMNNNRIQKANSSIINLVKFTNNLYKNDGHLNKGIVTKKIDMNNFPNNRKNSLLISSGCNNNIFQKKKLIISFGLNEQNKDKSNAHERYSFKRKISKSSNKKNSDGLFKSSFSNYIKIKKNKSPSKERKMESNHNINKVNANKMFFFSSNKNNNHKKITIFNSIINNDGDFTSKSSKYDYSRAKTFKPKKIIKEKILEESVPITKAKTKYYAKINHNKSKIIESNKNEINDLLENKKTSPTNKSKKFNKINFFCCLSCKNNDDSELN
jgi:hypothetical protein